MLFFNYLFLQIKYSLRSIVIELFCHFDTFHSNRVISLFSKVNTFFHSYFTLSYFFILSLSFYLFHFSLYSPFT